MKRLFSVFLHGLAWLFIAGLILPAAPLIIMAMGLSRVDETIKKHVPDEQSRKIIGAMIFVPALISIVILFTYLGATG